MSEQRPNDSVSDVLDDIHAGIRYRQAFAMLEKLSSGDALPDEMTQRLLAVCDNDLADVKRTLETIASTVNEFVRTTYLRAALELKGK